MRKSDFQEFINKYYLGGISNLDGTFFPVPIQIQDKVANVILKLSDGSTLISVDMNMDIPDGEIIISDTPELSAVLNAFGPDIEVQPKKVQQYYFNQLHITDNEISAKFALADPVGVTERAKIKGIPQSDCSFKLTKDFTDKFLKAKRALTKSTIFAVIPDTFKNKLDFIINYSQDQNVNSITVPCENVEIKTDFEPLFFNVNVFAAILSANTEYREATVDFSGNGFAVLKFKGEDYDSLYMMVSLKYESN